jgi:predicted branched-subunit amino acid permease
MVGNARAPGHRRQDLLRGFAAVLPLSLANVPFALAYALAAKAAGLGPAQAMGLSLLVFAGSAQFVSVGLIGAGAGPFALGAAVLLVNLRHLLLGAALAPRLAGVRLPARAALAFGLTDEAFAVSIRPLEAGRSVAFLAGAEAGLFVVWQGSIAVAALLGAGWQLPRWLPFDLVLPLSMLALLVAVARGARDYAIAAVAAVAASGAALAGAGAFASLVGIATGAVAGALAPVAQHGE